MSRAPVIALDCNSWKRLARPGIREEHMDQVMETRSPVRPIRDQGEGPVARPMEVKDMAAARRFYTEFPGLECFRHNNAAMMGRKAATGSSSACKWARRPIR